MLTIPGGRAASTDKAQCQMPGEPSTEPNVTETGPNPCSAGPSHVHVVSESPLLGTHCPPSSQRPTAEVCPCGASPARGTCRLGPGGV